MWGSMDPENFVKFLSPLLRERGFKKSSMTWRKDQGESVAVLNVQRSQWDKADYYVNLGLYFRALGEDKSPTENKCHVRVRLPVEEPSTVVSKADEWFLERAMYQEAANLAAFDSEHGMVVKELKHVTGT